MERVLREAGGRGGGDLVRYNAMGLNGRAGKRVETTDVEQLAQHGLAVRDLVGDEVGAEPAPRHAQAGDLRQALDHGVTGPHEVER